MSEETGIRVKRAIPHLRRRRIGGDQIRMMVSRIDELPADGNEYQYDGYFYKTMMALTAADSCVPFINNREINARMTSAGILMMP